MKKLFNAAMFAASLFAAGQAHAQTAKDSTLGHKINKTAKKVGNGTADAAKTVGNGTADAAKTVGKGTAKAATTVGKKTAEVASKGASVVVDKKYDGKVGPGGQAVYINDKSQYYYVNKSGHRVYLKKSDLVNKP